MMLVNSNTEGFSLFRYPPGLCLKYLFVMALDCAMMLVNLNMEANSSPLFQNPTGLSFFYVLVLQDCAMMLVSSIKDATATSCSNILQDSFEIFVCGDAGLFDDAGELEHGSK
jgi:hypothetical protein